MNELASAIEEVRTELAGAANEILFDLCDLDGPTFVDGAGAGDSVTIGSIATNLNISYKGFGGSKVMVVGGETYTATHELKMVRTSTTVAITPRYLVKVQARGNTGQLIFQQPFIIEDSMSPFLKIGATLVKQGYQQ
jgi:hypothetical protein